MTSSSSRGTSRVIRRSDVGYAAPLSTPDLRSGTWTRMGDEAVLGDDHTELVLSGLADRARVAAEAQGYADGWAKGVRDALEASAGERAAGRRDVARRETVRAAEHTAALEALLAAALELELRTGEVRALVEEQALDLALAVTEVVLGRQAAVAVPADVVRRVVEAVPDGAVVRLRLHPVVAESAASVALPPTVSVVPDPSLGPADALAELEDHLLDLRVDRAFDRVREALR